MAELVIRISGDIKNYEDAIAKAEKETGALSETLSSVAQKSAIAFAALTAEIGLSVAAYRESELVTNKLTAALQAQGIFSDRLVKNYQDQATELQNLTGLSDEAIISAQTSIQAYLGQTEVTQELTTAIADLSAAKGIDLQSTAELIGKGINGQTAALKKAGIEIDDNLSKQERLAQIIEKVTAAYGGQAAAAGLGLGALGKLREAFGNLQEQIGARFAPIIEKVATQLANFFTKISNNPELISLGVAFLSAATAVTGVIAALSGLGVALLATNALLAAFGVTATVALGPLGLLVAAIVAAAAAIGYFATQQEVVVPKSEQLRNEIAALSEELKVLENSAKSNTRFFSAESIEADKVALAQKQEQINKLEEQYERQILLEEKARAASSEGGQNSAQAEAANRRAAEQKREEDLRLASRRESNRALLLESQRASEEEIALAKERSSLLAQLAEEDSAANRAAIQQKLDDNKTLQAQAAEDAKAQRQILNDELLAENEEFEALSDEQKEAFLIKNQANAQSQILTENQARQQAAQERLAVQTKEHNDFLLNQQKFGTAYATINQIMNSTIVQGSAKAFGELAALQTSSNATLKGIGRAAATASIIIKTAESAMAIYAGFSTIPIIGPSLGIAGAAAAVAFGAEQVGKVNAAAEGGLLEGGIPGVDSIPVLAQQGELVVPRQNFDEVVGAVASQRTGTESGGQQPPASPIEIVLTLKDDLADFLETQFNERDALGISVRAVRA